MIPCSCVSVLGCNAGERILMKLYRYIIIATLLLILPCLKNRAQTISGIVNTYYKVTDYVPAYNGVRVLNVTGLSSGDHVMIIQMKGATIDESNSSSFGNINSIGDAGKYEFATICGFLNDTVIFERVLLNNYDYTKHVQLVRIPVYNNVTITGTVRAQEWDSTAGTGGVVAIEATGTITMNAGISADSAGFKGGPLFINTTNRCGAVSNWYYSFTQSSNPNLGGAPKGEGITASITDKVYGRGKQANGGGGGNVDNTGGGGGANYGAGGNGGNRTNTTFGICNATTPGIGGIALNSFGYNLSNNRIFMGGGGGCGEMNNYTNSPTNTILAGTPGGDGGGIVFIMCNTLVGNGNIISANGAQGVNPGLAPAPTESYGDGGGGGGAGGVVLMNVSNYAGTLSIQARGADGCKAGFQAQCPGPGGGGGGGFIWSNTALPGTVTTNVNGGAAGIVKDSPNNPPCELTSNGATAGANGSTATNFTILQGTVFNCGALLSLSSLKEWFGKKVTGGIVLNWKLEQTTGIEEIWLEKKAIRGPFKTLKIFEQPADGAYTFTDASNELPATYRLMLMDKTGKKVYSSQLFFEREKVKRLTVYPNPVQNELKVELPVTSPGRTMIAVYDFTGKLVASKEAMITTGQPLVNLPLRHLTPGTYTIRCYWGDELYITKIVKQ